MPSITEVLPLEAVMNDVFDDSSGSKEDDHEDGRYKRKGTGAVHFRVVFIPSLPLPLLYCPNAATCSEIAMTNHFILFLCRCEIDCGGFCCEQSCRH